MFRAGLIGLGNIASRYSKPGDPEPYCHAGGIAQCKGIEVAVVADDSEENSGYYLETWGNVSVFTSGEEMLEAVDLDVVAICTPPMTHQELTLKAIDVGVKVVFVEKPLAISLNDIDEINSRADEKGSLVVVSHTRHWGEQLKHMARLICQKGLIGNVQAVTSVCDGPILTFAVHGIDMLCQFAGYDPVSVCGYTSGPKVEFRSGLLEQPLILGAVVKFKSGVIGYHRGQKGPDGDFFVEIIGTKGVARVGFSSGVQVWDNNNNPIETTKLGLPPTKGSPFKKAYQEIVDYLLGKGMAECTREQYMPVYEITFGLMESFISGQMITLPCKHRSRRFYAYR